MNGDNLTSKRSCCFSYSDTTSIFVMNIRWVLEKLSMQINFLHHQEVNLVSKMYGESCDLIYKRNKCSPGFITRAEPVSAPWSFTPLYVVNVNLKKAISVRKCPYSNCFLQIWSHSQSLSKTEMFCEGFTIVRHWSFIQFVFFALGFW